MTYGLGCTVAASTKSSDKLGKCARWISYSNNDGNESISKLVEVAKKHKVKKILIEDIFLNNKKISSLNVVILQS